MRVLVMNDHPFIRKGIVGLLESDAVFEWIVEATSFDIGLSILEKEHMDIVIVDVKLGKSSGYDFIIRGKKISSASRFVIFTASMKQSDFIQAKEIGIDGYIFKNVLLEEFVHALKVIHKGRKYYDPDVVDLTYMIPVPSQEITDHLTAKEKEVLIELGKGKSNREIALELFISEFTVKKHVSQILSKLELSDRTQAALHANALGLVTYAVN
ncbi:LuxR C-terminal-related transcriptional regulator [Chryseomicrobium palamuruense]|uniref:LuxR C-terminal-related transcriptional regulator n=1 Tax=Chryseomicrobium palamuruense TaxID=682973 RepID=A0ABV8UVM9_9BACL